MKKLLLFDIDGTLIDSAGAGTTSLTLAFFDLFSIKDAFADIRMAGKTDIQIIREGLSAHNIPGGDGTIPLILSSYIAHLKKEINNSEKHLMPGVMGCLKEFEKEKSIQLGLLTGNIRIGAQIKLGAFDIFSYFPFGAFGDDDEDRNSLLPIAVEKYYKVSGMHIPYKDCIVIGDTPWDVRCAKPYGALSIAVSTGPYSYDALTKTEADHVLKDLTGLIKLLIR